MYVRNLFVCMSEFVDSNAYMWSVYLSMHVDIFVCEYLACMCMYECACVCVSTCDIRERGDGYALHTEVDLTVLFL